MAKFTKASLKAFIKKNKGNLFISTLSRLDGMVKTFKPVVYTDWQVENTLGISGAWFVGNGRDYFIPYEHDFFTGWEVYNSCGSFILAVKV